MPAPCSDSLSVSPAATTAAAAQERNSAPFKELFEDLHSMCIPDSCVQIQLLKQAVEHKHAGQQRHSAMHPEVHHWVLGRQRHCRGWRLPAGCPASPGGSREWQTHLWDRLYFVGKE